MSTPDWSDSITHRALTLAETGVPVFPCGPNKRPAISKKEGGRGFHDATTDKALIRRMFKRRNAVLIGFPNGPRSGCDLLDIDPRHGGDDWAAEFAPYLGDTLTVQTRSGGTHFFYKHRLGLRNSESVIAPGVDTRGDGGYSIAWAICGGFVVRNLPIADWPDWLAELAMAEKKAGGEETVQTAQAEPFETSRRREVPRESRSIRPNRRDRRSPHQIALDMIGDALVRVENAYPGQRHTTLRSASVMVGGLIEMLSISDTEATRELLDAVRRAGAENLEIAKNTITSGLEIGKARPLAIEDRR